jgi:pimeloyl-ACP methyl ester carboxylesterase
MPTRFSVVVEGAANGPAVLLLPDVSSSRAVFDDEARQLAPHYRLYRVQIAGFAGEPAGPNASGPVLVPVVEELHRYIVANHLHPAVIGHSMGGLMALMLTTSHPEDVSRTMVIAALPFYGMLVSPTETVEMLRPQALQVHNHVLALTKTQFDSLLPEMALRLATGSEARKKIEVSASATDRTVYANATEDEMLTDIRPQLASIQTPVTVVFSYIAALDGEYAPKTANLYADAYQSIPHLTLAEIDDSHHFVMYDQPEEFHNAVVNFLK